MELKHWVFYSLCPHRGRLVLPGGGESFLPHTSDHLSLLDAVNTLTSGMRHEEQIHFMVFDERCVTIRFSSIDVLLHF